MKAVWLNFVLFGAMLLMAALVMKVCGSYPSVDGKAPTLLQLVEEGLHLAHVDAFLPNGSGVALAILMFLIPVLTVFILGEGTLRAASVYLQRHYRHEEWGPMVAKTFSKHTVICGVGELGKAILRQLVSAQPEAQVVLVDSRPTALAELTEIGPNICLVQKEMQMLNALEAANCRRARLIIMASGNDAYNLEAGFKASDMNPEAEIWIRLYCNGLSNLMDRATNPNIHFFSPYESAAQSFVHSLTQTAALPNQRREDQGLGGT